MNGRGPQDDVWSPRSLPTPLLTRWLGPCSVPGTRADCAAASSQCSCENQLRQWRWGGGAARRQEGRVQVELEWEDCIGEGRPEPAKGVNGAPGRGGRGEAPSPFNREPLFLRISHLD